MHNLINNAPNTLTVERAVFFSPRTLLVIYDQERALHSFVAYLFTDNVTVYPTATLYMSLVLQNTATTSIHSPNELSS